MHHIFIILILCIFSFTTKSKTLPLETALDAHGYVLFVSSKPTNTIEIQPTNANHLQAHSLSSNKISPNLQIAHRHHIANDPSCRWLAKRLDELENRKHQKHGHKKSELAIRLKEWNCMKCGAQGPSLGDHNRCQYRR